MDKGTRVKVVRGNKDVGVVGTVFWVGENRYGPGQRLGIKGDDGQTYWMNEDLVEETTEGPPEPEGPVPQKGDRVQWRQGDLSGYGRVFWTGKSRSGPFQRFGVEDDDGETRWFDQPFLKVVDAEEGVSTGPVEPAPPAGPGWEDVPEAAADDPGEWQAAAPVGPPPSMEEPPAWDHVPVPEDEEAPPEEPPW